MSDYTDIQPELDDFENAVYGEEVRDSMISAIKKIHDTAESAAGAPDASTATAGQVLTADGAGGHYWGDVESGDSIPTEVRQAIFNLLNNNAFANDDTYTADLTVLQSWATEITSISVSPTTLNINGMSQETIIATTVPAGGTVTWSSSDESIATVSGGVVTPTGVNGTCTITASCGGKSATCAVTVSGFATLLSINAVYTQSGTVYDTDTLDSLKSDLAVTANWSDGRSLPVTDYTLQGTLTEGTSTIVVTYGGKTTTFGVTVTSGYVTNGLVARWDGLNNTANGHDATSTIWKDLVGEYDFTTLSNVTWDSDGLVFTGDTSSASYAETENIWNFSTEETIEIVLEPYRSLTTELVASFDAETDLSHRITLFSDNTIGFYFLGQGSSVRTMQNTESDTASIRSLAVVFSGKNTVERAYANNTQASLSSKTHSFKRYDIGTVRLGIESISGSDGSIKYPFRGKIMAIRVYNRKLTAEELSQNHTIDAERFGLE